MEQPISHWPVNARSPYQTNFVNTYVVSTLSIQRRKDVWGWVPGDKAVWKQDRTPERGFSQWEGGRSALGSWPVGEKGPGKGHREGTDKILNYLAILTQVLVRPTACWILLSWIISFGAFVKCINYSWLIGRQCLTCYTMTQQLSGHLSQVRTIFSPSGTI